MARRSAAVPGPAPAASFARSEPRGAGLLGRSDAACGDPDTAADPGNDTETPEALAGGRLPTPTLRGRRARGEVASWAETKPNRGLLGVALVALLVVAASGCARWVGEPDFGGVSNAAEPGPLRVLTTDGRVFILENVSVANDTVSGISAGSRGKRVQLPLNAVKSVERKVGMRHAPQSPLGVVVLVALSVIAFVFGATHAPQM